MQLRPAGAGGRPGAVTAKRRTLSRARAYSACLVALIYLQDILWLALSRVSAWSYPPPYLVSAWQWPLFLLMAGYALGLSALGLAGTRFCGPLAQLPIGKRGVTLLLLAACAGNLFIFLTVAPGARYTSGGLTGTPGLVYGIFRGLALGAMVFLLRMRALDAPVPRTLLILFILSYLLTIDGFSPGLTLFAFVALMFPIRFRLTHLAVRWPLVIAAGLLILAVATQAKWAGYAPDISADYLVSWLVPRFAIQSESMYSFLAGDLGIASSGEYLEQIVVAVRNRFYLLSGSDYLIEYPRSVSEAVYFSLFGTMGSGSSPGALLGTALFGPWLWIGPLLFGFLFVQLFYHWRMRLTLLKAIGLTFLLKPLYADPSEYFTVISPTLVYAAFFCLGCVLVPRQARSDLRTRPDASQRNPVQQHRR